MKNKRNGLRHYYLITTNDNGNNGTNILHFDTSEFVEIFPCLICISQKLYLIGCILKGEKS